ncbi:MAG: cobyrinate a,c-diamide synthase [Schwartzia sp. (in: firmicutes)]
MADWHIPRVVIAATQSGSGKTTIVTGLLAALRARGLRVQSYKIGPDYIDPGYHALASGHPAHNLDTWLVPEEKARDIFCRTAEDADIAVIEGVMGLYDGGTKGISSTAAVAKLLDAPVLLVINAKAMGESAAALALGFRAYDPAVRLSGVILNRLGSDTHRAMIEEAMARLDVPVYGAVRRDEKLTLPERHLGLLPAEENARDRETVAAIGQAVGTQVDLAGIEVLAKTAPDIPRGEERQRPAEVRARIAVAKDEAFSFYYPESLRVLEDFGAEILPFSPLHDAALPEADGLLLGGGFPEMFAADLYANEGMRQSIRRASAAGMPVYAECGGYMYLMEKMIDFSGQPFPMLGIVPGTVEMNKRLQTVGYVEAVTLRDMVLGAAGIRLKGHEFHFSSEQTLPPEEEAAYPRAFRLQKMRRPAPYDAGYAKGNIVGSYLHLHFAGCPQAAEAFVAACETYRRREA